MAASDLPQGYQCEFIDSVSEYFNCRKCSLVARRLTFTSCCGESYCHSCIADIQQQAKPCPACGEQNFTYPDQVKFQRQIRGLQVYCSMRERGCDWLGPLEQLDTHLDPDQNHCQHLDTKCPLNCQLAIPKNKVDQHVAKECVKRNFACLYCAFKASYEEVVDTHLPQCIYFTCEREMMEEHARVDEMSCEFSGVGCDGTFRREDQEEHERQNGRKHLTLTATAAVKTNQQLQRKLQEQEQKLREQEENIKEQEKSHQELERKQQEQEQRLQAHQEKKFTEQARVFQELLQEHTKNMARLQDESSKNKMALIEASTFFLKQTFVMENFSEEKAKDQPFDWKSPAMYTHVCGYKFCIGVSANGSYGARAKAMGVQLYVLKGEYDDRLKWPAEADFTIELVNQKGGENKIKTIRAVKWGKPKKDCEIRYGFACNRYGGYAAFLEHSKVNDYLSNDALYFNLPNVTVY